MKRRKRVMQKRCSNDESIATISNEPAPSDQIILPAFDFSKRSHQAAFWMLLNTVIYKNPRNSASKTL